MGKKCSGRRVTCLLKADACPDTVLRQAVKLLCVVFCFVHVGHGTLSATSAFTVHHLSLTFSKLLSS